MRMTFALSDWSCVSGSTSGRLAIIRGSGLDVGEPVVRGGSRVLQMRACILILDEIGFGNRDKLALSTLIEAL